MILKEYFYRRFHSKTLSIKMARRRYAFRIPFVGKKITMKDLIWYGAVAAAVYGLYSILANRDVGIPFIDQPLEAFGDITGLEGRGQSILPSIFGAPPVAAPAPAAAAEPGWNDWRFTNAYQTFENYDEMRFSNAYKNE